MKAPSLLLLTLVLIGCEGETPHIDRLQFEELGRKLDGLVQQAEQQVRRAPEVKEQVTDAAGEEVEKLFTFEYRVFDLPRDAAAPEVENRLATLGADRWECFHVEPLATELRVFCKRRPKTPLRYLQYFRPW